MAELLIVKDDLSEQGWADGAVLVKDESTGDHYVVSTVQLPWQSGPETLVYRSDAEGSTPTNINEAFVAGDLNMTREEAFADLSARIDEGRLFTDEEAEVKGQELIDTDFSEFMEWAVRGGLDVEDEEAVSNA